MSKHQAMRAVCVLALMLAAAAAARAQPAPPPNKRVPLARCLPYNSYGLTPEGMMQCSYPCGDRIIMCGFYQSCPGSGPTA